MLPAKYSRQHHSDSPYIETKLSHDEASGKDCEQQSK
jgi:hypothetical protein